MPSPQKLAAAAAAAAAPAAAPREPPQPAAGIDSEPTAPASPGRRALEPGEAQRLYNSHWVAEGSYFSQSEVEREVFVLRQGTGLGLVGDGVADDTDPFTLERVELEPRQRAEGCRLSFEQVYEDGTRMRWRGELDSTTEAIVNGEWTALSGAGIGARIGTFTARRMDPAEVRAAAAGGAAPPSEAELEQEQPAEPGSPTRRSDSAELPLRRRLELEEEQTRAQVEARLVAEVRRGETARRRLPRHGVLAHSPRLTTT